MNKDKMFLICPMLHQGGFERVCVNTARILQDEYDITIVIFDDADIAFDITGLKVVNLNLGARPGKFNKAINVVKRVSALKKLIREERPKVCYSFGPTANLVNVNAKTKGTQVYIGLRSYMEFDSPRMLKMFCSRADRIICCSKEIENRINKEYGYSNTVTIYNPFDIGQITEASKQEADIPWKEDGLIILSAVGREDNAKGYWHMIKAFKQLYDVNPDTRLMIIGDGEYREYKELASKLGVSDKIWFTGVVKNPYKYVEKSDIYLLTSVNEGFPNCLVEAMCLNRAVVATNCKSGPAEILLDDAQSDTVYVDGLLSDSSDGIVYADYGIIIRCMSHEPSFDIQDNKEEECLARLLNLLCSNREMIEEYSMRAGQGATRFGYEAYKQAFTDIRNES